MTWGSRVSAGGIAQNIERTFLPRCPTMNKVIMLSLWLISAVVSYMFVLTFRSVIGSEITYTFVFFLKQVCSEEEQHKK